MCEDIWCLITNALRARPAHTAWRCRLLGGEIRQYSYQQVHDYAVVFASHLRERSVYPGDVVGILAANGPEWGVAALAVWKLGGVIAPLHTGFSDDELVSALGAIKPKLVLVHGVDRRVAHSMDIVLDNDPERIARESKLQAKISGAQEAIRSYTSGSSGHPKMVRLSHNNIISNVTAAYQCVDITDHERFLSILPLSHMMEVTGGFLLPLYSSSTIVLPRVLAAKEILDAMAAERVTAMIGVPRLYRNIMQGMEKRFRQAGLLMVWYRALLKKCPLWLRRRINWPIRHKLGGRINAWISGGSRLDPAIAQYFRDLGLPLRQGYGLTETSPVICIQDNFEPVLDSVGRPLAGIEVKIIGQDIDGSGELLVKGPNVMLGYVDLEQTHEVLHDGWFRTGDLARLDEVGNIILTGRCKRLIVTEAGKNVYPEELETLLERVPGVKEAGVLEVGMRPAAVMALDDEDVTSSTARAILREFNARVSSHNHITRFALVDELPRTPVGKVAFNKLPEIFAQREISD
ncbi:MAG: long-chain fatty acid--CoA ligase [Gammaproteobacteria bacterium]|nr:long-chain fatty acid--CoA ligase [Gammaproteobacteria bacterium]